MLFRSRDIDGPAPLSPLESACSVLADVGLLTAPQISRNTTVMVSFVLADVDDAHLCDRYQCQIYTNPEADISLMQINPDLRMMTWMIDLEREGRNIITLLITDVANAACTLELKTSTVLDTTPPHCESASIDVVDQRRHKIQLVCSEEVIPSRGSISVSENGVIEDLAISGRDIWITVRRLDSRQANIDRKSTRLNSSH